MKKAVILGERRAGLIDTVTPTPVEDWALIKVHVAPMCTEYKAFVAGRAGPGLGHEAAGEVVEVGAWVVVVVDVVGVVLVVVVVMIPPWVAG